MHGLLFLLMATSPALAAGLYPRQNETITPIYPTGTATSIECTITDTTTTTLTDCPRKTKCHGTPIHSHHPLPKLSNANKYPVGQTVTWTAAEGPVTCAPDITCTCVLPTAPPIWSSCPEGNVCIGQTITWSTGTTGPTPCKSTCTVQLPIDTARAGPTPTASPSIVSVNGAERVGAKFAAMVFAAVAMLF
ncbi:hypothetical protein EJ08DRAFT_731698 [Tothia fuscella]|uniref:Ig-like domain-containing protein n=1 Tax=Tothia fuscella TaxID=1048955 RepID=A0A9P4U1X3_9PEZI|nr:hypothetical protein EJ08DRAFT_731698 [Tothia fuscella]